MKEREYYNPILHLNTLGRFKQGANIYCSCRKQGLTIRETIDCLIAAACINNEEALFHKDSDFDSIARLTPLQIHPLSTS